MKRTKHTHQILAIVAGTALTTIAAQAAVGQLGILDTSGTNPATGVAWQVGDKYHLLYVTTATTDATSTAIADYNAFVQADAAAQTGSFSNMGTVSWFALGSTTSTDAIDNVIVTGPVMNAFNSSTIAVDAADLWDFQFSEARTNLAGESKNVWTGSNTGGVASGSNELGAANGTTRRHWSAWADWGPAFATEDSSNQREMIAISEELTVVPEPTAIALFGLGAFALLRRRRK